MTNGMLVYSHAEYGTGSAEGEPENGYVFEREGVRIELMAGEGVGVVTKPGLNFVRWESLPSIRFPDP